MQQQSQDQWLDMFLPKQISDFLHHHGFYNHPKIYHDEKKDNFQELNLELIQWLEYYFVVSLQAEAIRNRLQSTLINSLVEKENYSASRMNSILKEFERAKLFIYDMIQHKNDFYHSTEYLESSNSCEKIPRIIRLCDQLELSNKEFMAFAYVLVCQSSSLLAESLIDHGTIASMNLSAMTRAANMNTKEALKFIGQDRLHIQQGLVVIDSSYKDTISSYCVKMPTECINALIGITLTAEEFLKIDKTKLSEILLEEESFVLPGITTKCPPTQKSLPLDEEIKLDELDDELLKLQAEIGDQEFDVYEFMQKEKNVDTGTIPIKETHTSKSDEDFLAPYNNDIEYLDDRFQYICAKIRLRNAEIEKITEENDETYKVSRTRSHESVIRELKSKCRLLLGKCEKRMKQTTIIPRLEKLAQMRGLDDFEKWVLIMCTSSIICLEVVMAANSSHRMNYTTSFNVGYILWVLCDDLQSRISHRSYFYKQSKLISDCMIRLSDKLSDDLMECSVDIDRRMLDYLCGLDLEFSHVVEGSHLFYPKIKLENVVLPDSQKQLIVETVSNFEKFKKVRKQLGFEDIITYGNSIVMLFYGASGTGKTLTSNALANYIGKKMLLVNFSNMTEQKGDILKYVFREAKINDALLFFDECDQFFESRKKSNSDVTALLTEIEKFDGLIILATNRQYELDEAMYRRITLAVEFKSPDSLLRKQIWRKHIPSGARLANDVDFDQLSLDFEITGGLIKNAIITALSFAVSRDSQNPIICHSDLHKACQFQLKGYLKLNDFERKIIPKRGLSDLIISENLKNQVKQVISFEKSRKILFNQWGFENSIVKKQGTTVLIVGPAGVGKSLAAEVISYEIGQPMKVIDINELMTKYSFNTTKNIETLFKECKETGALLVLECVSDSDSHGSQLDKSVRIILNHLEHFEGAVVMIASSLSSLDSSLIRRFKFVLEFSHPSANERKQLWRNLIPQKVPKSISETDFEELSERYAEFSGSNIENCIFRACSRAVMESSKDENKILTSRLLFEAAEEELKNCGLFMTQSTKSSLYF
ncbi:hypothetical protein FDP41_011776 [Naegleria fowleri]|uniref:AAA+ ATPase domain-containing protein n=1 Tax=Naegleria fowleri TaxID=5763 RepID=A0A6A5C989_NAEFO|nr:uncharacterized protein FDP41_011776 [Naegleria fowleri]KAF0981915.1 hypothetical protein FDP41_011776 [Naegleria fowleri]